MKTFEKQVIGNLALPPIQRTPVGYLRGQHSATQSRFTALVASCGKTMSSLCA
jgi:hypothetical protein